MPRLSYDSAHPPAKQSPPTPQPRETSDAWQTIVPGLRRLPTPPGPALQYIDPIGFEWNIYELAIPNLPSALKGLRIIHLSDLHCRRRWLKAYDDLAHRLNANVPDLILFTGDLVESMQHPWPQIPTARRLLEMLPARLGVFGIQGNHDISTTPADFARTPLQLIDGQRLLINAAPTGNPSASLELIATPGPWRQHITHRWFNTLPPKTPGTPRVVISHYPDHVLRMRWADPDLFLAGHTHGGQVCLPNGFPILRHDSLPRRLSHGVHRFLNTWFAVNRGFGFSSLPIRAFCPAEVIELRLIPV